MHAPAPTDVSIVIVNWNSRDFLAQCLRSIVDSAPRISFDVIVIDNASYDGSEALLRRDFPDVVYLQSDENLGFARANNAAAKRASSRQILFLNPDTEVIGPAIERMSRFLDATPGAGAVGCKLLNSDGSLQTSCVQAFPTVLNQTLDSELLRRMFPASRLWGTQAFLRANDDPIEVEALSGACILVDREAFFAVGGFTEDYFMYAEDVDLCFKLRKAGRRNYYLADVCVTHHGGQSSGAASESQFGNVLMRESIAKFLRIHHGRLHSSAYRVAMATSAVARIAALWLARFVTVGRFKPGAVRRGLAKWKKVLRWTVGAEPWVRNPGARPS